MALHDTPGTPYSCLVIFLHGPRYIWVWVSIREDINSKRTFSFGHFSNYRGGLPMSGFFGPFLLPSNSPQNTNFYSNFTVMVCFLVIFVIIIIKITIIIIVATIIIIIKIFSGHTRKTWFLTSKKEDQVARIRGMGGCLGDSGNARKKTFFCY